MWSGYRVAETAHYCRQIDPSEPEYEIRYLHGSARNSIFTRLEIPTRPSQSFLREFDVIGGKNSARNLPLSKS